MTANITPTTCRHACRETWACEHGGALPSGPFPGTHGGAGDVRRCEHGRIWHWAGRSADWTFDHWERLSWWGTPIRYRRARRALDAEVADA